MLFRSTGLAASLAVATQALMIVPETKATEALGLHPAVQNIHLNHRTIMNCPGCPLAERQGDHWTWKDGVPNVLAFDFAVPESQNSTLLNGVQIFPPSPMSLSELSVVQIAQPKDLDSEAEPIKLQVSGFDLSVKASNIIRDPKGHEVVPVDMSVLSLNGRDFHLPGIRLVLIRDPTGRLWISHTEQIERPEMPHTLEAAVHECRRFPLLCKVRAIVAARIRMMKHIIASKAKPCGKFFRQGRPSPDGRHHRPEGKDRPFHHRHGFTRFLHTFGRVAFSIFVPILIGVAAGMFTYLLGWAVGTSIACIYIWLRGRRNGGYNRVALDEEDGTDLPKDEDYDDDDADDMIKSEKELYVVDVIAEVEGEAPPVYVEVAGKEVSN